MVDGLSLPAERGAFHKSGLFDFLPGLILPKSVDGDGYFGAGRLIGAGEIG